MKLKNRRNEDFQYDICLSFAGEDRAYVERAADRLRLQGVRVFYDKYESVELWGKDLYSHLDFIYRSAARYCVVFVSKKYATKLWTNHERRSAQSRAFSENKEYILPARFDDTEIPGLSSTVGYLDLRSVRPQKLASMITEKLGRRQRSNFLPPVPDRLYKRLGIKSAAGKERVFEIASSFFEAFGRMSNDERKLVSAAFLKGCPADLPENVHINLDLLRRITEFPPAKIKRLLAGINSLGFQSSLREDHHEEVETLGRSTLIVISFAALRSSIEPGDDETNVVSEVVFNATENLCEGCGLNALIRADFSQLASATAETERHKKTVRKKNLRDKVKDPL